jgi:hypothetical protein
VTLAGPQLDALHAWMIQTRASVWKKSEIASAIDYALARWRALTRYCEGGRIEIDNHTAERLLRAIALGRNNYLFAGSDAGGERGNHLLASRHCETQRRQSSGPSSLRARTNCRSSDQSR